MKIFDNTSNNFREPTYSKIWKISQLKNGETLNSNLQKINYVWLIISSLETGVIKMPQTDQIEPNNNKTRNDPAFEITEVNTATGGTTVVIQRGIIGAMANQLKNTSDQRKGASILRKLGHLLTCCGDIQYGCNIDDTGLDPNLVTNQIPE